MNIVILGAGAMGSAFSFPCTDNGHEVTLVGSEFDDNIIANLKDSRVHPTLKIAVSSNIKLKTQAEFNASNIVADILVVAVSSHGVDWVIDVAKFFPDIPVVILTKGFSFNDGYCEVFAAKFAKTFIANGFSVDNICAVAGPCLASGLANRVHTSVVLASYSTKVAKHLCTILSTDYYHISHSDDIVGVEICSAIKNIFAIALGATITMYSDSDVLNHNEKNYLNSAATVLQQSLYEMSYFVSKYGGKESTVYTLAGYGDLYVSDQGGRNSLLGTYFGKGHKYSEIKKDLMPNVTVEGAELAHLLVDLCLIGDDRVHIPLLCSVVEAINSDSVLEIPWHDFNNRSIAK